MMQLLLATFLFVLASAELRVSKQFTGQQSSHPVPQPGSGAGARRLQVIGWAELCERKKLTAGSCFQLQPTVAAPLCELQGPHGRHGAPAQLRPATAGILTLTSGELRITGQIQMTSLRLAAKTVNFADAHVEAWHEGLSDPNSTESGGAFFSNGSFTLTRSHLTVRGAAAVSGGGFAADGDLSVLQDSEIVIENISAKYGAGFHVKGNVYISDNSMIFIQNARSTEYGGGFATRKRLRVTNSSVVSLQNVTARNHGGGFLAIGEVEIAGNSTVKISNSRAGSGNGGGFGTEMSLKVSTGSRLTIRNATAGMHGGGFFARGKTLISSSTVSIQNTRAPKYGGGFVSADEAVDEMSSVSISDSRSGSGGGFLTEGLLQVTNSSVVSLQTVTAQNFGGGFNALGKVEIAGNSTVNISNSHVESGDGGGFATEKGLKVSMGSRLIIRNATAGQYGGGFSTLRAMQVTNSSVVSLQNVTARNHGGGFLAIGEVEIAGNSTVKISNSRAEAKNGGGFDTEKALKVSNGSRLIIRNATAGRYGGGFYAKGKTLISRSAVTIQKATAQEFGGGFVALDEIIIDKMSSVSISNSRSAGQGGGFQTDGSLQVTNSSVVSLLDMTAGSHGGGFIAIGGVEIAANSTINMSNSRAESDGGGFRTDKGLKVSTGSRLIIRNATAGMHGGGFFARGKTLISSSTVSIENTGAPKYGGGFAAAEEVVIDEMSSIRISNSRSRLGGGFHSDGRLQVTKSSCVSLQNVTAQNFGGGLDALGGVEIAGNSTINISNSRAEFGSGGGLATEKGLKVSTGSRLIVRNAFAGKSGGGFYARGRTLISSSTVGIQDARAQQFGAGFCAEGVAVFKASTAAMFSTHAGADGGAFAALRLFLHGSSMSIGNSTAAGSGSGGRADGLVLLSAQSTLVVKHAQGLGKSSVLAASCLHLRDRSQALFEGVVGGHGVELKNSGCSALCLNSTFHVAEDAALNSSGRLSSGLLSLAACPKEKVRLSGIHLRSWSSALLSTRPSSVVVDQVSVDYEPPVNNLQVLAAKDGFEIESLAVSCRNCTWGITFNATKDGTLKAVSSEHLQCSKTATVSKGLTQRCKCPNYLIVSQRFRDVDMVPLESIFQTCMFCMPHFHFQNGDCSKCGVFIAWSDGNKDVCHVLPRKKRELIILSTGAAVVVILTFLIFEILHAPLVIVDAKSALEDPTQAKSKRIFMLAVQGPIVDLHKSLSRLVHQRVQYRAKGTGLVWLDYDQKKSNAIKVRTIARRKLLLQDTNPLFDCASCKGSLHAADYFYLLGLLTACISVSAMLPVIIKVAVTSGNGVGHVFVTAIYVTFPLVTVASLLHLPVAWLIRRLYRGTSFSEALDEYRTQINCKPFTGPDAAHPVNQGLEVLILRGLWEHFESFILERNMHFVVANIVTPLTQSREVSFVTLWGGRRVKYFVSHSWGTSFPHFVRSIQCHAMSKEGSTSWIDAAYWICSFANNQWDIGAAVGSDPMQSNFARALRGGIKGVAMVLDQEVQPLTRVWCLFEFLLSSQEHLELVFVTSAGVIGDDGCSSFDVALEVGKKIKSLQVAKCEASSEKHKKDIFDFIISKLGSLRRMDKQIRALMAEMLMRNLSNVERATGNLVDSLGPVVTLNEECFQSHVASGILQIYSNYSKFCTHCDFLSTHKTVTRPMELTHLSN